MKIENVAAAARGYVAEALGLEGAELEDFVDSFLVSWKQAADDFAAQAESPDLAKIREINHRVRGLLGTVEIPALAAVNEEINAAAKAGDLAAVKAAIAKILA